MKNYQIDQNVQLPLNTADFPRFEEILVGCKDEPGFEEFVQRVTGPDTGCELDDNYKLQVVPGWHVDDAGYVVKD